MLKNTLNKTKKQNSHRANKVDSGSKSSNFQKLFI